jgi:hypothetical protein
VAIAAVGLTPAAAEPARGQAGATSRASLTIAVSVAPRAGVRWTADRTEPAKDAGPGRWCAWSTSAIRTLFIELRPTARHLVPALPIRVEAGRSPADCEANDALQLRIAELRASSPAAGALLLVAPE